MSKNITSNFLSIDDYKSGQNEDYMNIAKRNEEKNQKI